MKRLLNFTTTILITAFLGLLNQAFGQALPKNVAKIGENIYSYGGYAEYYSMFIVTSEGYLLVATNNLVT